MEYPRFVDLRRPLWEDFESGLFRIQKSKRLSHQELEELAFQYRQVLHDHALAQTRYPGTSAARRLRRLALEGTRWLSRDQGERLHGPVHFALYTFPNAFRRHLPMLGITTALFVLMAVFGLSMVVVRPELRGLFLPPSYLEGLKEGHLWTESLTTSVAPAVSSAIATNNMSVALLAWAGGALAGLGALWVVLMNGFMLGAVVGVTLHYSMATPLLEFVAAHGPLEITLILTSAAAGLVVGRSLVVAEDRPRNQVVRAAARDALVILLGCLPWFLLLGVVESFISPSREYGVLFKVLLGLALEVLFLTMATNPFHDWSRGLAANVEVPHGDPSS